MNDTGTKTAAITRVIEMIAPDISCIASILAVRAESYPSSSLACTASTTTMASSTTIAIARTRAESVRRFSEKPKICRKKNVPTRDTGTAIAGISVLRKS